MIRALISDVKKSGTSLQSITIKLSVPDLRKENVLSVLSPCTVVSDEPGRLELGYWHDPVEASDICRLLRAFHGVNAQWR
jgi:hypothetical protein